MIEIKDTKQDITTYDLAKLEVDDIINMLRRNNGNILLIKKPNNYRWAPTKVLFINNNPEHKSNYNTGIITSSFVAYNRFGNINAKNYYAVVSGGYGDCVDLLKFLYNKYAMTFSTLYSTYGYMLHYSSVEELLRHTLHKPIEVYDYD